MSAAAMTVGINLRRLAISLSPRKKSFQSEANGASQIVRELNRSVLPRYQNASSGDTLDEERLLTESHGKHRAVRVWKSWQRIYRSESPGKYLAF
jgi:hypothetical protein